MAKQYTEYDVDLANQILDRAGYSDRDAQGFRLGPDGQRISLSFVSATGGGALEALLIDAQGMIADYWAEVGIDADVQTVARELFDLRYDNNEHDALMWTGWGGDDLTAIIDPRFYVPITTANPNVASPWARWQSSGGQDGARPPAAMINALEAYEQALATPDEDERDELMRQVLGIVKDEFYVFGIALPTNGYGVAANNYRNLPDSQPDSWPFPNPGQSHPEQYFIDS